MSKSYLLCTEYQHNIKEQCGILVRTLDSQTNESFLDRCTAFNFGQRELPKIFPFPGRRKSSYNNNVQQPRLKLDKIHGPVIKFLVLFSTHFARQKSVTIIATGQ